MKDFLDELEGRLQAMAVDEAAPEAAPLAPARARPGRRRRPALLAGATASLAALGTVVVMSGTSLADLPILGTPTTDATSISDRAPAARKAGVDFSKAHAFRTPGGTGYVFLTPSEDVLCLTMPIAGDRFAGACEQRGRVEHDGLFFEDVGDLASDPDARSTFAFVLPEAAERVRVVRDDGGRADAEIQAGVIVAAIDARTHVVWQQGDRERRKTFEGPFSEEAVISFSCSDGRLVTAPIKSAVQPGDSGRIKPAVRKRLCG